MSQNGQKYFKNLAALAARFLKCVWPFWDIMRWSVKDILYDAFSVTIYRLQRQLQEVFKKLLWLEKNFF